jgi:DNA (cytosine-5)-methyltransferase 1
MIETNHITGKWFLSDLDKIPKNNYKVMSCFHCGGGSTMGYKLSGFDVLGGVEIDEKMMQVYKVNHKPKFSFNMSIVDFNLLEDSQIPKEFFNIDILDGSPPCSSFSISGNREKDWGKNKKFREGQKKQVLDDLFFHFIDTVNKLKPKIVVAENVKGLISGNAKGYVKEIFKRFKDINYSVQLFLLNSAFMGVPQKRERVFFIARKNDLGLNNLKLNFNEKLITIKEALKNINEKGKSIKESKNLKYWYLCKPGESFSKYHPKGSLFNRLKLNSEKSCPTISTYSKHDFLHWDEPITLSNEAFTILQSFPLDFNFLDNKPIYILGMSVPPFMLNRISKQIQLQWLDKYEKNN